MELFDLHCDTLCEGWHNGADIRANTGHVDLKRGGMYTRWVQAFAAWLPDNITPEQAKSECFNLLDLAHRWSQRDDFHIVRCSGDLYRPQEGCNALLTVENGGALGEDISMIRQLYQKSVRAITLTWNGDNAWASGCFGDQNRGLTDVGRCALDEMSRYGIVPDLSHINDTGFYDVLAQTAQPVIATHTASRTIHRHPRNLTDEQFCAIRDRGGLVGLCLYPEHLGGADLEQIRRHLEHFLSLDGEKTVCFGADFDGMTAPAAWNGLAVMNDIKQHLSGHGWTEEQIRAVFYTNAHDFFCRVLDANH